mmetsp:Transcript_42189/g.30369  ORF Transcript_42189/g.30369 Transcript_42189/m.30369 type:complete len:93 (-) Transcript_42189:222-500(-)
MEAINSTESRKLHSSENMKRLEKAINISDQRIRMKRNVNARVSVSLTFLAGAPLTFYLLFHWMAPSGVMMNFKATNGAYMYWVQNFLYPIKS